MNERISTASLCMLFCVLFSINLAFAESRHDDNRGTISVTGTASENYPPDTAEIVLAIETTANKVSQAMQKNKISADKVISVLKELISKVEEDTIKTSSFSLQPIYEYDQTSRKNRFVGYKVSNQITLKSKQIEDVGKFIDSATDAGANRVDDIRFALLDDRAYCKLLLRQATERARSEADAVAESLGTKITGIKDVSASCGSEAPRPLYRFGLAGEEAMAAKSPTPVEAGTVVLTSSVRAMFYTQAQ
jgi:uncharacterized protein YggE